MGRRRNVAKKVLLQSWRDLEEILKSIIVKAPYILEIMLPYIMLFIGQDVYEQRGEKLIGGEVFVPIIVWIVSYYSHSLARTLGKGKNVPVPMKRFTEVDEDGQVSVEQKRLQELLLYVADVEDWLEKKGLL